MADETRRPSSADPPADGHTQDVLERSPELAAAVFRASPAATILSHYSDGRCLDANDAYCRLTGWDREELIGKTTTELNIWLSVEDRLRTVGELLTHGRMDGVELTLRRKSGELIDTVAAGEVFTIAGRRYILSFFFDITARKRAEAEKLRLETELQQAHKLESVGRLAGGVAHDFNNMLQVILAHTDLGLRELTPSSGLREHLHEIHAAAARSADLTHQLLAFARRQPIVPRVVNPNQAIEQLIHMLERVIGEDIELVWQPSEDPWNVKLDPSQLDQILANLFINARDAIAGAGRIVLETANVPIDASDPVRPPTVPTGDYVVVAITDTGRGMTEQTLAHVFEPFFTTKEVGQGTGLGLATVYGIVTQNGGYITATSELGCGSTFRIHLPRCREDPHDECGPSVRPEATGGPETILVVEDEASILGLVVGVLAAEGYQVLRAARAADALRVAEQHAGPIALLVTDVVMPEMDGEELRVRLSRSRPELRCLYMSGHTADVIARHGIVGEGLHFISKPFTLDALVRKVREVLEA